MAGDEEKQVKLAEAIAKALMAAGGSAEDLGDAMANVSKEMSKQMEFYARQQTHSESQISNLEQVRDLARQNGQLADNTLATAQARIRADEAALELLKLQPGINEKIIAQMEMKIAKAKEEAGAQGQVKDKVSQSITALTGVSDAWKGTLIGSFFQGDFEKNMDIAIQQFKDQFSAANMLGSALMKVQESTMMMVVAADAQFAQINQLTGTTGEYNDTIMETMENNTNWNVSVEDAGEAVASLYQGMSDFSNMTKEAQGAVVETAAQLKTLGVDTQTTAANFEIMTGALGMTADQAADTQMQFAAMASELGVSAGKIAKDFERNANVFTAYGDQAVEVFKETAAAAKATGIEMDALLGITTQFDTFEGAAKAAGQLNAVLGGGLLNSMDLLNASEEERVRMLIQSVEQSGKSWQEMSKFEKQAVANAAGINDMTEANKLFGTSLAEYDAAQAKTEENAEAQAKLEERAAAAATMQDKLKRIMEQFAVAVTPIINAVHFLLDGFLALNDMTGGLLVPTLIGLGAVMMMISKRKQMMAIWSGILQAKMLVEALVTGGLAGAKKFLAETEEEVGDEAIKAAPKMAAMTASMASMSAAMAPMVPAITAIGLALFGLGLAIAAPFIAMAVLVWSLKELVIAFMEMPEAIIPAMAGLLMFGATAMVALPMFGIGVALMMAVLAPVAPLMFPVALGLIALGGAALIFGLAADLLGSGIKSMAEGMNEWDVGHALAFAFSLIPFGIALMFAAVPFLAGSLLIGVGALVLGMGLQSMGKGISLFVGGGMIETMLELGAALFFFGIALMFAAVPFLIGAILIGVPALILGMGLQSLAAGIEGFTKRGMFEAMGMLTKTLFWFGLSLLLASPPFLIGATLVGAAALLLGVGLATLAMGLEKYNQGMMETMVMLSVALFAFGWGLFAAGFPLLLGGAALLLGALAVTPALLWLWLGIKPWEGMDLEWLAGLGDALLAFAAPLMLAGIMLMFAGIPLLMGAALVSLGFAILAIGMTPFMNMDLDWLSGLSWALFEFAKPLFFTGVLLMFAGFPFFYGATLVGLGMGILGLGLTAFMNSGIKVEELPALGEGLRLFAWELLGAAGAMMLAGIPFFFGALLISFGLAILNAPLAKFAETLAVLGPVAPQMPAIAEGLRALGEVLPGFGWGIFKLGLAASMPFFKTGLKTLSRGLSMFARAMGGIPEDKALALGNLFQGLELFSSLSGLGKIMREIGWGIWWIGNGLKNMPEGVQAIQFSVAAESLAELAEAAVDLTPEAVENVQNLADAAIDYGIASRLMRSRDEDALVAALQELAGIAKGNAKGGGKEGQDVVLEIDGKEFARAVSAAIDSKHNMPF